MSTATTRPARAKRDGAKLGVFTAGDVGRICKVTARTAVRWCDTGVLRCHRIPHGKDRRVTRADLLAFMREHGFEIPTWLEDRVPLLAVGFTSPPLPEAVAVRTAWDAGAAATVRPPRAVAVDVAAFGRLEAAAIAASAAKVEPRPLLIAVWHEPVTGFDLYTSAADLPAVVGRAAAR